MPPQTTFLGVPLSDVAVVAAVLGGFFSLSKEGFSFFLRWLERRAQTKRQRRAIYGRLAQHYFHMGVGAWKVLQAWGEVTADAPAHEVGAAAESPSFAPHMAF